MRPQPQPSQDRKTGPSRTSVRSGDTMGIGEGARPRQAQNAAQPHQGLSSVSFFFFSFYLFFTHRTPFVRGPVRQQTCRTHDATTREGERLRQISRWSPLRALNLFYAPFRSLPLEGVMFNSPIPCLSHYLYRSALTTVFLEQVMQHPFASNCISLLYICSFMTLRIRTFWYG